MPTYLGPNPSFLAFSGTTGVSAGLVQINSDSLTVKPSGLAQLSRTYACPAANVAFARALLQPTQSGVTGFSPSDYPTLWLWQRPKESNDGSIVKFACEFYGVVTAGDFSQPYTTYSSSIAQANYSEGGYRATYNSPIQNVTFVVTAGAVASLSAPTVATLAAEAYGVTVSGGVPQYQFYNTYAENYFVKSGSAFSVTGTLTPGVTSLNTLLAVSSTSGLTAGQVVSGGSLAGNVISSVGSTAVTLSPGYSVFSTVTEGVTFYTPIYVTIDTLASTSGTANILPGLAQISGGVIGTTPGVILSVSGSSLSVQVASVVASTSSGLVNLYNPPAITTATGSIMGSNRLMAFPTTAGLTVGLGVYAASGSNYVSTYITGFTSGVTLGGISTWNVVLYNQTGWTPSNTLITLPISVGATGNTGFLPSNWGSAIESGVTATVYPSIPSAVLSATVTGTLQPGGLSYTVNAVTLTSTAGILPNSTISLVGTTATVTSISGSLVSFTPGITITGSESVSVTVQPYGNYVSSFFNSAAVGSSVNLVISNRTNYGMVDEVVIGWQLMVNNS